MSMNDVIEAFKVIPFVWGAVAFYWQWKDRKQREIEREEKARAYECRKRAAANRQAVLNQGSKIPTNWPKRW